MRAIGSAPGIVAKFRFAIDLISRCAIACAVAVSVSTATAAFARGGFQDVSAELGFGYTIEGELSSDYVGMSIIDEDDEDAGPDHYGGGISLGDIDNDGHLEIYVAHGHFESGRLFVRDGERYRQAVGNRGIVAEEADRAGYFVDLDEDGWQDFVSIGQRQLKLFRNDGAGNFREATEEFGIRHRRTTHSMAAADVDLDGDLDLFFAHWGSRWNTAGEPSEYLWRNDGLGRFTDMSRLVEIRSAVTREGETPDREFSFTPTFADIDNDGDPDMLLTGDFKSTQVLRNDGGHFRDATSPVITDEAGMGAAVADFDRDGDLDWFVTSILSTEDMFEEDEYEYEDEDEGEGEYEDEYEDDVAYTGNRFYRNDGGVFTDVTDAAGVRDGGWAWGTCFEDFDNDGHVDLFLTNGSFMDTGVDPLPYIMDPSKLYMATGDGRFRESAAEFGITHTGQGRGLACADHDGDGRVDIFIANLGAAPTVYANRIDNGNGYLTIELVGRTPNRSGVGARVTVETASWSQVRERRLGGAFMSQHGPWLHFGLGGEQFVTVTVRWPGADGGVSRLERVPANQRLVIRQPAAGGQRLHVVGGEGSGHYPAGAQVEVRADPPGEGYGFSHWSSDGGGVFADARSPRTTFTMPEEPTHIVANNLPGPPQGPGVSVARRWSEVLLQAIRKDFARPTVHARNLFHVSAAMYDAWLAFGGVGSPFLAGCAGGDGAAADAVAGIGGDVRALREEAISHAAYGIIQRRFVNSPGVSATRRDASALMGALGFDPASEDGAAAVGAAIARCYLAHGDADGANEANDYANVFYNPVNESLSVLGQSSYHLDDPNRWQPLALENFIDQSGNPVIGRSPPFLGPEWGAVTPFALLPDSRVTRRREGYNYVLYHDPGPPPLLRGAGDHHYREGFALVAHWSAQLSLDDGVMMDISPGAIGNITDYPDTLEEYADFYAAPHGPGHAVNPATGRPYQPQVVPRGDYVRVLAEFWADGPDSETPPGHWFVILNEVSEKLDRRLGGRGEPLAPLEWDVKTYFALGGAMHDAAIAAWGAKGWYDYVRPVSALRYMAELGQSSDPSLPSWHPSGVPLAEGLIELIGPDDPLLKESSIAWMYAEDEYDETYGPNISKIKFKAWLGPGHVQNPREDVAGVGWILADRWVPYQRPTFVTPPFAGYVSGHSTFSRAAAEMLTRITGDPFFPGGMGSFEIAADEFLAFEDGPSVDMVLQWATYRDAADQCSLSRIWGGIHPPADDIPGRHMGDRVGRDAFRRAMAYFSGAVGGRAAPRP